MKMLRGEYKFKSLYGMAWYAVGTHVVEVLVDHKSAPYACGRRFLSPGDVRWVNHSMLSSF